MYIYCIEVIKLNKPIENNQLPKWLSKFLINLAICMTIFFITLYVKEYFPKQIEAIHSYIENDSSQGLQTKARDFILKYSPVHE